MSSSIFFACSFSYWRNTERTWFLIFERFFSLELDTSSVAMPPPDVSTCYLNLQLLWARPGISNLGDASPLGGLERFRSSCHLGTFVSVGTKLILRGMEKLKGWEPHIWLQSANDNINQLDFCMAECNNCKRSLENWAN